MNMVADALLAIPIYPWFAHQCRLHFQCFMAEGSVHYYVWIRNICDERVMLPTDDLVLIFLQ